MLGAMIGDIAGSRFEFNNIKTKNFTLFTKDCFFTDDTVMTVAVARALLQTGGAQGAFQKALVGEMQALGQKYPNAGYGGFFSRWLQTPHPQPYGSFGNGSAMRVSPCGWAAKTLEEALALAKRSAEVTHDHPAGIRGAQAVAAAVFLARCGKSKEEIRAYTEKNFYPLRETLDEIRPHYTFDETCPGTVPPAMQAFLEAEDFEDSIRLAVSLGGDSDTLAAITGSIAEAYFGIPNSLRRTALSYLPHDFAATIDTFARRFLNEQRQLPGSTPAADKKQNTNPK